MNPFDLLFLSLKIYHPARMGLERLAMRISPAGRRPAIEREKGQGLVEYALILVLVAVVVIVVLAILGPRIGDVFAHVYCGIVLGQEYSPSNSYLLHDGTCTINNTP